MKELFLREKGADHQQLKDLINEAIEVERESAREVGARYQERARSQAEEERKRQGYPDQKESQQGGKEQEGFRQGGEVQEDFTQPYRHLYTMFVLLRTETAHSAKISKMLYIEQDKLELESKLTKSTSHQAFIYGNGFIEARDFREYPEGFRVQCQQAIREYSSAQAITIACQLMKSTMDKMKDDCEKNRTDQDSRESINSTPDEKKSNSTIDTEFQMCLITDGRLKNDQVFGHALSALLERKEAGCQIRFIYDKDSHCEACDKLLAMAEQ